MENKQPEDDLFDRLNVSGQSAVGWRRGPARATRAPKGEVCPGVAWTLPLVCPVPSYPRHTSSLRHIVSS